MISSKIFRCDICEERFNRPDLLKRHYESKHLYDHSCNHCDLKFPKITSLRKHQKETHTDFECELCKKIFNQMSNLRTHLRAVHQQEKRFSCDQ